MENNAVGVRKGAWTREEDTLLRKCMENYGEGKWHLVPLRAGLNRCRKSCRLRWLNYLRPNIKRGYFSKDEVDLIVRLHKLLGNRWSLIAGRLPGRTANDVKNFWNTHIDKKPSTASGVSSKTAGESSRFARKTINKSNIVRPRPRTFSKSQPTRITTFRSTSNYENLVAIINRNNPSSLASNDWRSNINDDIPDNCANLQQPSPSSKDDDVDACLRWWGNLLEITESNDGRSASLPFPDEDHHQITEHVSSGLISTDHGEDYAVNSHELMMGNNGLSFDVDVWELVGFDYQ